MHSTYGKSNFNNKAISRQDGFVFFILFFEFFEFFVLTIAKGANMKTIIGDLIIHAAIDKQADVIIHGCNCRCTMGAGVALQIKQCFPDAYRADLDMGMGEHKLGSVSYALVNGLTVVNAYTQLSYGRNRKHADEHAIRRCFKVIKHTWGNKGLRFAFPLIGCGLAGGTWSTIGSIIEEEMDQEDITLVKLRR
jgi:O-acetyl-ADP-ribose deacetylase (regulator of RNase III)